MTNIIAALIIAAALVWSTQSSIEAWAEPVEEVWVTPSFCGET